MGPEFLTAINAKTALETPQILLEWTFDTALETPLASGVLWKWTNLDIRRSIDRYPEDTSEGTSILSEAYSANPSTSKSDTDTLLPFRSYYYSLFLSYLEHCSSTLVIDDDIERLGSQFGGVVRDEIRVLHTATDGVSNGTAVFTSASSTFLTDEIEAGFLLEIDEGAADDGFYRIASVDSETQVTLDTALTLTTTNVDFNIYSDHQRFWIGGFDYQRKQTLWRFDSRTNLVDLKIDLSELLNLDERIVGLAFAGDISGTRYVSFATTSRYIRIPDTVEKPTSSDVTVTFDFSNSMTGGYEIAGLTYDGTDLWVLDTINLEVKRLTETSGAVVGTKDLSALEEIVEGSLRGIGYDSANTKLHIGNRNYVYRLTANTTAAAISDVDRITYTRELLRSDLCFYIDELDSKQYVVIVNDDIDKLRSYEVEIARGYLWQQPFVADDNTVGLYHLEDATDSSQYSNDGTNNGMTTDVAARFSNGFEATAVTHYVNVATLTGFDGSEGSASIWVSATDVDDLTSGNHKLLTISVDANNSISVQIVSGNLQFQYIAGGTAETISAAHPSADTDFHNYKITWSSTADQVKAYVDGIQFGSTQTGLGVWSGSPTAQIGDSAAALLGIYDECRISDIPRVVTAPVTLTTSANKMHATSGRDYEATYEKGDPIGFFYRDELFTPRYFGGEFLLRNDYERERLSPLNKTLSDPEEIIFRGPDPLPVLGDLGRLTRLVGLLLDRIADDRHLINQIYDLNECDVDFLDPLSDLFGLKGLDIENWNVDKQRRFVRIMRTIHKRGGRVDSYRIYAKLLGYYITTHTLLARRRWDTVVYSAIDPLVQPIYLDEMGSMDTWHESFPLALLRFVVHVLSTKSDTGATSAAASRLLTDSSASFRDTTEVGSLIVIAQGQDDAGTEVGDAEYTVEEVHSDTQLKVDRDWEDGNNTNVTYYNYTRIPEPDPHTDFLLTQFLNIAPDSMRVERLSDTAIL